MFYPFRKNVSAHSESESAFLNRIAHVVDPRRFAFFTSIRSSGRAVRKLRAQSLPDIARDLEEFRSSVSGHGQFSRLAEVPVRIDPDEDRAAYARRKKSEMAVLGWPLMDVWFLLKEEDRPHFLSFVVGHEYGHLILNTGARSFRYLKKICTVKFLVSGILGLNPSGHGDKGYRIVTRAYHAGEFSADAFSVKFCTELGYRPERGISAFELMEWLEWNNPAKESFSHPSTNDRIERILRACATETGLQ